MNCVCDRQCEIRDYEAHFVRTHEFSEKLCGNCKWKQRKAEPEVVGAGSGLRKNRINGGTGHEASIQRMYEGKENVLTAYDAEYFLSTGKGIAVNAGHEHSVIRCAGDEFELVVYRHFPAVTAMEGIWFREHEFEMRPGDTFYVYTDGVPEATNAKYELHGTQIALEAAEK